MTIIKRNYWEITLYDPRNLSEKLMDKGYFKTAKDAQEGINKCFSDNGYDIKIGLGSFRLMASNKYDRPNSKFNKYLEIKKVVKDVEMRKSNYRCQIEYELVDNS